MGEPKPNRKYVHAFAIIRADKFVAGEVAPQAAITVTRVVWDWQTAETEVARLNQVNQATGAVYFWQMTRIDRSPTNTRDD